MSALLIALSLFADDLSIGDPIPPTRLVSWHNQEEIELPSALKSPLTVLEYATAGCPACLLAPESNDAERDILSTLGVQFWTLTDDEAWRLEDLELLAHSSSRLLRDPSSSLRARWGFDDQPLPYAIVVDDLARVLWEGDPRDGFEERLLDLLASASPTLDTESLDKARTLMGYADEATLAFANRDREGALEIAYRLTEGELEGSCAAKLIARIIDRVLEFEGPSRGGLSDAVELCEYAVEMAPQNVRIRGSLVHALVCQGDIERALETIEAFPLDVKNDDQFTMRIRRLKDTMSRSGKGTFTGEDFAKDLDELHAQIRDHYAGYDDIAVRLAAMGETWISRTNETKALALSRDLWVIADIERVLLDYLSVVRDTHFAMTIPGGVRHRLVQDYAAFFSDLRIELHNDAYRIIGGDSALEGQVIDPPQEVHPGAVHGRPYLFPVIPNRNGAVEYRLGAFSPDSSVAPTVDVMLKDGTRVAKTTRRIRTRLDVDEAMKLTNGERSYEKGSSKGFATFAVRSCLLNGATGLGEVASTLHEEPVVLLDLRGNIGGSDMVPKTFCEAVSRQEYQWWGGASLDRGAPVGPSRWTCFSPRLIPESNQGPKGPYEGRLFIFTDGRIASSGESFVSLASQIPGALRLGENTAGCTNYGNVIVSVVLPTTQVAFQFGHTKFDMGSVCPTREGLGVLPHYWLDGEDIADAAQRLLD